MNRPVLSSRNRRNLLRVVVLAIAVAVLGACGAPEELQPIALDEGREVTEESQGEAFFTIGDIDPDTPAHRIRRIKPLADHLAATFASYGVSSGRVVIARDIEEMARMLEDGTVDLYIDSTFPSLSVRAQTEGEILLEGSIRGDFEYSGLFVTSRPGVGSLEDLLGQVVAFEERHSTSGYLLPYGELIGHGLSPVEVTRPDSIVGSGQVGYYFSGDEENSLVLALDSRVAAAAVSTNDWQDLPAAHRDQLRIVASTRSVPRQLVTVAAGLAPEVLSRFRKALLALPTGALEKHSEAWVWDFRELSPEVRKSLSAVEDMAYLIREQQR